MKAIQNIWCVGRNYADHAKELGNTVPTSPLIFLKSGACIARNDQPVQWPTELGAIHHEVELALQFDDRLELSHFGVSLDFTARDRQVELKNQGQPWTLAKSFTNACLLGELQKISSHSELQEAGEIFLQINGRTVQHGHFKDMIFSIENLAKYVKAMFPVQPGDLLLTGTPKGVGPLNAGDEICAWINNQPKQSWRVGPVSLGHRG